MVQDQTCGDGPKFENDYKMTVVGEGSAKPFQDHLCNWKPCQVST